jgi:rare lipoprotein A
MAVFSSHIPCMACSDQPSELDNASSWSVSIEEYRHSIYCFSRLVAAQAQSWTGKASYYGGRGIMTCAHRSLPFGTHVRVTNLSNNRTAVLVVNDRGPYIKGRIIDVSTSAADVLGFRHAGLARVTVETVSD